MSALTEAAPAARPAANERSLRVAVACSGLGHISRGIESWAEDLGAALRRAGQDVTLFQGAGEPAEPWRAALRCRKRFDPATEVWVGRARRLGGWRFGCGSGYQLEQTSFTWPLWRRIRRDYDVLHVQDTWIALLMDRLHRAGLSRPRVILAHGTEETPEVLRRYSHLQVLAPCHQEEWEPHRPAGQTVHAIPNFVDVDRFRPGDRAAARAAWDLPQDHLVVLCVAAIKKDHKRIDYLVREFAAFARAAAGPATLVVAGARERETDEVTALGRELLGDRVRFIESAPRERMPSLYQAADLFAFASLHEAFGIALLEALATGVPVLCHELPVLKWIVGEAGATADLSREGALAAGLAKLASPEARVPLQAVARARVEAAFSEAVVVRQMIEMYREVAGCSR